jgi:DNA-binding NtrC family response regulator
LRERKDVIPALVAEFLADAAARSGKAAPKIEAAALAVLASHSWPGNVRELKSVVERAMLIAPGATIEARHILIDTTGTSSVSPADDHASGERARIVAALGTCAGNQTKAAKVLRMSRATLAHARALADPATRK